MTIDFNRISHEELPQAQRIAEYLSGVHCGGRFLDIGCGPGLYVYEMRRRGMIAWGVDIDERIPQDDDFYRIDVTNPSDQVFGDCVLSLEVGEHMQPGDTDAYIRYIKTSGARSVYFSAARPGQGGEGHINCQPKDYWSRLFFFYGFYYDPEETERWLSFMRQGPHMGWLTQNGMVFKRYLP